MSDRLSIFTTLQKQTLVAITDTFIASLDPDEETRLIRSANSLFSKDQVSLFSKTSASSIALIERLEKKLPLVLNPKQLKDFLLILNLLTYHLPSLLLTGHWTIFKDLGRHERESVMLKWKHSSISALRRVYFSLMGLTLTEGYFPVDTKLFRGLEYPGIKGGQAYFENQPDYEKVNHERLSMLTTAEALGCTEFDAIVIGSGAGGGVAAAELSKSGMSVLVIEKGKYFHQDELVDDDLFAFHNLYETYGITPNSAGTVATLSGSTFGGGTVINYSASLKVKYTRVTITRFLD
jgi:hypothetical protein